MKRIENTYAIESRFFQGDLSHPKTPMTALWLNSIQEELCHAIESEGITLNKASSDQLSTALIQKQSDMKLAFSFDIPSQLDEEIAPEIVDYDSISLSAFFEEIRIIPDTQAREARVKGMRLNGLLFDQSSVISAQFFALIERYTETQSFCQLLPVAFSYAERSYVFYNKLTQLWVYRSFPHRWVLDPLSTAIHCELLSQSMSPLSLALIIGPDGQMYVAGRSTAEQDHYGKLSIFNLKTVSTPTN